MSTTFIGLSGLRLENRARLRHAIGIGLVIALAQDDLGVPVSRVVARVVRAVEQGHQMLILLVVAVIGDIAHQADISITI